MEKYIKGTPAMKQIPKCSICHAPFMEKRPLIPILVSEHNRPGYLLFCEKCLGACLHWSATGGFTLSVNGIQPSELIYRKDIKGCKPLKKLMRRE